jgi:N-methylhydantoinase A
MAYRLGIDIGGTFTDFSLLDQSTGRLIGYKSPTIPADLAEGVAVGLREVARGEGIDLSEIEYFVHGTTIGLNTVIQRSGADLALLVTAGFRDILEIQRLRLADPVNFNATRPAPLIPRWRVFEIQERLLTDGSVDTPLDRESVERALRAAVAEGVDGVAVCLVNAYRNPAHEQAIRAIAAEVVPDLYVTCSHEVWPQIREYERAIVAILNAYIRPKLATYLDGLADRLREIGLRVEPYITKSNGGVMTARGARDATVETLLSGPASGVVGAIYAAKLSGYLDLLTLDMGGTSADIAIIRDGEAIYSRDEHVGDFPVIMPAVGVSSIGAGGGSVAWIDRSGLLKVGPRSAGADPGPACYGRGATEPALSDAFLVCGFLNPDNFVGGRIKLDDRLARAAIGPIAEQLGLSVDAAAEAIVEVSTANMYAEFSQVMARHGLDPRDFTLVAFGGAGPIEACFLAAEFHIPRVLVPLAPGTLCALGALSADVKNDYVKTVNLKLSRTSVDELRQHFAELRRRAEDWLATEGPSVLDRQIFHSADLRYEHQSYEIELPIDRSWLDAADTRPIVEAFYRLHEQLYAHADPTGQVELISVHVKVVGTTPKPTARPLPAGAGAATPSAHREIHYRGGRYRAAIYRRSHLLAEQTLDGPAVVEQDDATVLIPDGFVGHVDGYGNLLITVAAEGAVTEPALVGAGAGREG